ncbi:hypothetical protein ACIQPP_49265 [Streptomyces violaceusniger]|nr:hypothetical protein [Streptomyces hygroscopicus]
MHLLTHYPPKVQLSSW